MSLPAQAHDARLIPAQFVKPFVKSNKNDFRDYQAIAEAVPRENMRFVPIKADEQFDLQALHRVARPRLVNRRKALFPIRSADFLLERAKGRTKLRDLLHHLEQEWKELQFDTKNLSELPLSTSLSCALRSSWEAATGTSFNMATSLLPGPRCCCRHRGLCFPPTRIDEAP